MSFSEPLHVIAQFDLQHGSRVADLGAGSGALSIAAARHIGSAGRVYAVEIQRHLLDRLKGLAREARLPTIEFIWGDVETPSGTHLKNGFLDAAIASNVLFQIGDRPAFVEEAKRILKRGGRLLLVDWTEHGEARKPQRSFGPRHEKAIPEKAARMLFESSGFGFVKKVDAGAHHYGMIFRKT